MPIKARPLPSLDELRSAFTYDPESGAFTRRRTGKVAGSSNGDGRMVLTLRGRPLAAGRVAWKMATGEEPPLDRVVDHINRDPMDNRLCNLRVATYSENNLNAKNNSSSYSSKYRGVSWFRGKWTAGIGNKGEHHHLGRFTDEIEAAKAYDKAATDLHGELAALNFETGETT